VTTTSPGEPPISLVNTTSTSTPTEVATTTAPASMEGVGPSAIGVATIASSVLRLGRSPTPPTVVSQRRVRKPKTHHCALTEHALYLDGAVVLLHGAVCG